MRYLYELARAHWNEIAAYFFQNLTALAAG